VGATPTNLPSFAPSSREEASGTPVATGADPAEVSVTQTTTLTATHPAEESGRTPTPRPTFTPPARPESADDDHYWLARPVAPGGTVWTDKHYPYGGTRGGQLRTHHGVEFNVAYDTEILAAAEGTVRVAGSDDDVAYGPHPGFYGNLVIVEHDFQYAGMPIFTLYGHLNEVLVSEGQPVAAQDVIGLSGATGVADGPHMHFEVRLGANDYTSTRNPLLWLAPFPDRGTVAGRVLWPNGDPVQEAGVSLNRVDGDSPYYGTTTYAGDTVNGDETWNENFAIDDVVAGFYEVVVTVSDDRYKAETWVYPYQTSYVEIEIE
jgi:murein DD-endopeptidase MepM/ murein hydrolase activator NlpD